MAELPPRIITRLHRAKLIGSREATHSALIWLQVVVVAGSFLAPVYDPGLLWLWMVTGGLLFPLSYTIFAHASRADFGAEGELSDAKPDTLPYFLNFAAAQILHDTVQYTDCLIRLAADPGGQFMLARLGLTPNLFPLITQSIDLTAILVGTQTLALETADNQLAPSHLLAALLLMQPRWKAVLIAHSLQDNDVKNVLYWERRLSQTTQKTNSAWRSITVQRGGGLGASWSSGATYTIERYAQDLTLLFQGSQHNLNLFGKQDAIDALERVLAQAAGANAILVGPAGIGKRIAIEGLAERMAHGQTVPALRYKRLLELNVAAVLSSARDSREVEARLTALLNEANHAGNVILFIDNIATLLAGGQSAGDDIGSVNAAHVLLPYLTGSAIHIVGTATPELYRAQIEHLPELKDQFQKIDLPEPAGDDIIKIVEEVIPLSEARNHIFVSYQAIKTAITLADQYIHDLPFPEKAISLLDQAIVALAKSGQSQLLTPEAVEAVVSSVTKVPVGQANQDERQKLLNLEAELHKRIIGQDAAITAVANALRRARSGLNRGDRPIGSFLFIGPTGVGKTETAKALAAIYFGREEAMIRFDMSEYKEPGAITRLIGTPTEGGTLTDAVRQSPFAVLLFDEIEKSHPDVRDLFLQVFDDGRLTDGAGRLIDFKSTLIIATSNAGAELIRQALIAKTPSAVLRANLLDFLLKQGIFKPEFINRFDAVISFTPLTLEDVQAVIRLLLAELQRGLTEKQITLTIADQAVNLLAQTGYDPLLGARPLRRLLQDTVENKLANAMLSGTLPPGSTLAIEPSDIPARTT